jgi:hypothetical protein
MEAPGLTKILHIVCAIKKIFKVVVNILVRTFSLVLVEICVRVVIDLGAPGTTSSVTRIVVVSFLEGTSSAGDVDAPLLSSTPGSSSATANHQSKCKDWSYQWYNQAVNWLKAKSTTNDCSSTIRCRCIAKAIGTYDFSAIMVVKTMKRIWLLHQHNKTNRLGHVVAKSAPASMIDPVVLNFEVFDGAPLLSLVFDNSRELNFKKLFDDTVGDVSSWPDTCHRRSRYRIFMRRQFRATMFAGKSKFTSINDAQPNTQKTWPI